MKTIFNNQERTIIIETLKANSDKGVVQACRIATKVVNKRYNQIVAYWYSKLSKEITINFSKAIVPFTEEQDNIIISCVKKSPLNISAALKKASKLTKKHYFNCADRWYKTLRHRKNVILTCGSSRGFSHNRKNLNKKNGKLPEMQLRPIDQIMIELLNLDEKDRRRLLDFFK